MKPLVSAGLGRGLLEQLQRGPLDSCVCEAHSPSGSRLLPIRPGMRTHLGDPSSGRILGFRIECAVGLPLRRSVSRLLLFLQLRVVKMPRRNDFGCQRKDVLNSILKEICEQERRAAKIGNFLCRDV